MATTESLVKQAEQNCLNVAKDLQELLNIIDALSRAGSNMFDASYNQNNDLNDFSKGIGLIRKAIYTKYTHSIMNCFMFTGVGGEEAIEFAYEQFVERFGEDKYIIMNLLNRYGNIPPRWNCDDEENFRKEAKKLINNKKKK